MLITRQVAMSASQERLSKLIHERLKPDTDNEKIDKRIWDLFGEKWAIMFTDLSGFSRGVEEFGIIHFLQIIAESHRIFIPCIDEHDGILLKIEGDSFFAMFRNVHKAVNCSVEMQRRAKTYNVNKDATDKLLLCVGLGYGDILRIGDDDAYGAEVNAASKLGEDTADAWEILVTGAVKDAANDIDGIGFTDIDEVPPGAKTAYKLTYTI